MTLEGDVVAWLYVLNDYEGAYPSARYLGMIADAAEVAGAPEDYVRDLRTRPCSSVGPDRSRRRTTAITGPERVGLAA